MNNKYFFNSNIIESNRAFKYSFTFIKHNFISQALNHLNT